MGTRMRSCPKCGNKVRSLYDWKGNEYCGMCQQENIERYEATLVYRFFLFWRLSIDYTKHVTDQVMFPRLGLTRRFIRRMIREIRYAVSYIKRKVRKAKG